MSESAETVAIVPKNKLDEIHVGLSTYNDRRLLDVRVFTSRGRNAGDYAPTTKGISVDIQQLEALRAALNVAERAARARGWPTGGARLHSIECRPPAA